MAKDFIQVSGFRELEILLKKLPDNVKKREVNKLLSASANATLKAAKNEAPVSSKAHWQSGKRTKRLIISGSGKKSIAKKVMTRSKNPLITISPRSRKLVDGFYLRRFVIPGTKKITSNPFLDRAYKQTKGRVTPDAENRLVRYIQRQINRLGNA